jgi:hypothetical protein
MKKATFDPARRLDLYFRVKRNGSKSFVFVNSNGEPRLLIYEEYELIIKEYAGGRISISLPLTISGNVLSASITEELSNINQGEYYWELNRTDTGKTWLCGKAIFHNGVFDGVDDSTPEFTISDSGETIQITITESGGSGGEAYTSGNAIEVDEDNKVNWGNSFTKNTSIPGGDVNVELGTTGSRLNRFLFRVASLFEILIPSTGAWRAVVGTAQAILNSNSIVFLHDLLIEFSREGSTSSVLDIITEPGNEQVRSNVPISLQQVNSQLELDAIDPVQYTGAMVFKNYSQGIRQPQPIYSNGAWKTIRQIVALSGGILNNKIFGTNTPFTRIILGEGIMQPGDYVENSIVFELMSNTSFTLNCKTDLTGSGSDQTILTMTKNAAGTYIITAKSLLTIDDDTQLTVWLICVSVVGPGDINTSGHAHVFVDPSEFFDLEFTATIAVDNQLYTRFSTQKIETAE